MVVVGATVVVVVVSSHPINPAPRMPPHLVVVAEVMVVAETKVVVVVLSPPNRPAMASGIHLYQSHLAVMELHTLYINI